MPRQLVFVIGTRAQLIKVAPVIASCERRQLPVLMLMTGQHKETIADLVEEFGLASPQAHAVPADERSTVRSLLKWLPAAYRGLSRELARVGPGSNLDVLVHGDTLSTLLGAWTGRRAGARVVHLESGLTSGRLLDPFPEEICRRLVFRLTDLAVCPNPDAARYMARHHRAEAFDSGGNTIIDAVALATGAGPTSGGAGAPCVVASIHRFQNIYDAGRLESLVRVLGRIAERFEVYFVLHPATRGRLQKLGLLGVLESMPGMSLVPRMGYRRFLALAARAECVLTDGGSNQEELAVLGVPTIVMRERSERPDGLGANAMLEADVPGDVGDFVRDGRFVALRRPSTVRGGPGPSQRIADRLAAGG